MTDKQIESILSPDVCEKLQWLAANLGDTNLAYTLRKSVLTHYDLMQKVREGAEILVKDAGGAVVGIRESMSLGSPPLNIYLVSQYENTWPDTYQSFVVAAYSEDEARSIHPHTESTNWPATYEAGGDTWVDVEDIDLVVVQKIGTADTSQGAGGAGTVYCRSFNEDRYEET
jgi:hypothetical protein